MDNDVIITVISSISTVIVACLTVYASKQTSKAKRAERAAVIAGDKGEFIEEWGRFFQSLDQLTKNTALDRFLLFRATNGSTNPRYTTAILQFREGEQEYIPYVDFELDADYIERIKQMKMSNIYILTRELPECEVKNIYEAEGVEAAFWCHIQTTPISSTRSRITYCSFATHDKKGFDKSTQTRFKILIDQLKGSKTVN